MHSLRRGLLVLGLALVPSLHGCGPRGGSQPMQLQPSGPIRHGLLVRIETSRAGYLQASTPLAAKEFAELVHAAHADNAYANEPAQRATDVGDAVKVIDAAFTNAHGGDRAYLVALRAVLLLDLGQPEDAFKEFARSMAIAPNQLAASYMIAGYVKAGDVPRALELCRRTAGALKEPTALYDFMSQCRSQTGALSFESSMTWAGPELTAWYVQETHRREEQARAAAEAQRQREAAEALHRAQLEREQAAMERDRAAMERDRAMTRAMCTQACSNEASACTSRCDDNSACTYGCTSRESSCHSGC